LPSYIFRIRKLPIRSLFPFIARNRETSNLESEKQNILSDQFFIFQDIFLQIVDGQNKIRKCFHFLKSALQSFIFVVKLGKKFSDGDKNLLLHFYKK